MKPLERQYKIIALLKERERISVEELAQTMNTSQETIRRDLNQLSAKGKVAKFHGGVALPPRNDYENAFQIRMKEYAAEKRAIASFAKTLFNPGDSIFIDTGTTSVLLARELASLKRITVITNSHIIAREIGTAGNSVFTIGGEYIAESEQNVGSLALEQISRFNAEHAVITAGALNTSGVMDFTMEEAQIARAMTTQSQYLTVITDSSKFNKRALFEVLPLKRISRLVVESRPTGELLTALEEANVEILVVPDSFKQNI